MAGSTYVRDVLWRVSSLLLDVEPQFTTWPEVELVNWLNDAQMAVAKFLPSGCSRVDVIKLKPGSRQSIESIAAADCKPGDGTTPSVPVLGKLVMDVVRNMGADGLTAGSSIRILDEKSLKTSSPNWHTVTGTAVKGFVYKPITPKYFYVIPAVPATPAVWVEIAHQAQPVKVPNTGSPGAELYEIGGSNTTVISLDDDHVDDIVNYVMARAKLKDAPQNAKAAGEASAYTGLFVASINAKATAITGNNPNLKRLPLMTEPVAAAS